MEMPNGIPLQSYYKQYYVVLKTIFAFLKCHADVTSTNSSRGSTLYDELLLIVDDSTFVPCLCDY